MTGTKIVFMVIAIAAVSGQVFAGGGFAYSGYNFFDMSLEELMEISIISDAYMPARLQLSAPAPATDINVGGIRFGNASIDL